MNQRGLAAGNVRNNSLAVELCFNHEVVVKCLSERSIQVFPTIPMPSRLLKGTSADILKGRC